jgi:hypothetical protein
MQMVHRIRVYFHVAITVSAPDSHVKMPRKGDVALADSLSGEIADDHAFDR